MLSLRARLLLGLVALVLFGLVASDVATYAALKDFSYKRVDAQLLSGEHEAIGQVLPQNGGDFGHPGPDHGPPPTNLPVGTYIAFVSPDGQIVTDKVAVSTSSQAVPTSRPLLPHSLPNAGADNPSYHVFPGTGGVAHYETLVEYLDQANGFLVIAIPLTDVDSVLQQLEILEALITALVLLAIALLALLIVRIGLRPLEKMQQAAAAIAGGELSRRVEPATERTEIGRLGLALNAMLNQIEAAFGERTASNQRLRRFLADASHELRTPLTSIRGYAEILRRGAEQKPEDAALARRRIEEEAVRMTALVDDLLLLARLDQGRPLARETVDLQMLVQDAQTDALAVAPNRPVRVVAPERVVITGDAMRLRQVLSNLVRNALVHTPAGTPIDISLRQLDGKAVLKVADHGPGLPPGVDDRVFEPFFRADAGRSRDRGGAGLGLSIVAAVVAAHGGTVSVDGTPGGGATFTVELPLYPPPLPAEAPSAAARVGSTSTQPA